MDICIVNDRFKMRGGVGRVAVELANALVDNNNQVSLIDFSGENKFFYEVNSNVNKLNVIKKRSLKRKVISKVLNVKNSIDKRSINIFNAYREQSKDLIEYLKSSKHDVIVFCQGILTSLIPIIKKEFPNLKVVAWQHNEYDIYVNQYYKKYINDYLSGIRLADLIVCLTEADQKKFIELNENSTYIYNPLTITNKDNKISTLASKHIIFVGRLLMEQKGLDYLIRIGKELKKGWKIIVAGEGSDKDKFVQMIKDNQLDEVIILLGALDNDDLVDLYSSGSIFISTSRWEGFGLVITEAMEFGLPIIGYDNLGPSEILKDGEYGVLIEKNNIDEFIVNLNNLVEDPKKREHFQKKSLKRVKDFKREVILKEWEYNLKALLK